MINFKDATIEMAFRCWINSSTSMFPMNVMVTVDSEEEFEEEKTRAIEEYKETYAKVDFVSVNII